MPPLAVVPLLSSRILKAGTGDGAVLPLFGFDEVELRSAPGRFECLGGRCFQDSS